MFAFYLLEHSRATAHTCAIILILALTQLTPSAAAESTPHPRSRRRLGHFGGCKHTFVYGYCADCAEAAVLAEAVAAEDDADMRRGGGVRVRGAAYEGANGWYDLMCKDDAPSECSTCSGTGLPFGWKRCRQLPAKCQTCNGKGRIKASNRSKCRVNPGKCRSCRGQGVRHGAIEYMNLRTAEVTWDRPTPWCHECYATLQAMDKTCPECGTECGDGWAGTCDACKGTGMDDLWQNVVWRNKNKRRWKPTRDGIVSWYQKDDGNYIYCSNRYGSKCQDCYRKNLPEGEVCKACKGTGKTNKQYWRLEIAGEHKGYKAAVYPAGRWKAVTGLRRKASRSSRMTFTQISRWSNRPAKHRRRKFTLCEPPAGKLKKHCPQGWQPIFGTPWTDPGPTFIVYPEPEDSASSSRLLSSSELTEY